MAKKPLLCSRKGAKLVADALCNPNWANSEQKGEGGLINPSTPEEWQNAADSADFLLALDSCRLYGLITGGPEADVDRCVWILEQAKQRGIAPNIGWRKGKL